MQRPTIHPRQPQHHEPADVRIRRTTQNLGGAGDSCLPSAERARDNNCLLQASAGCIQFADVRIHRATQNLGGAGDSCPPSAERARDNNCLLQASAGCIQFADVRIRRATQNLGGAGDSCPTQADADGSAFVYLLCSPTQMAGACATVRSFVNGWMPKYFGMPWLAFFCAG